MSDKELLDSESTDTMGDVSKSIEEHLEANFPELNMGVALYAMMSLCSDILQENHMYEESIELTKITGTYNITLTSARLAG